MISVLKFKQTNRFGLGSIFFSALYFLLLEGKKLMKSGRHENAWCPFRPMISDCLSVISPFPLKQYWSFDVSSKFFQKARPLGEGHDPHDLLPLGQRIPQIPCGGGGLLLGLSKLLLVVPLTSSVSAFHCRTAFISYYSQRLEFQDPSLPSCAIIPAWICWCSSLSGCSLTVWMLPKTIVRLLSMLCSTIPPVLLLPWFLILTLFLLLRLCHPPCLYNRSHPT